ncbi:MAG: glycerate kinase [Enterococcus sp.]
MKIERIIIAMDSFKGSISSLEAANCVAQGIQRVKTDVELIKVPIADGGEGTLTALMHGFPDAYVVEKIVQGPLGTLVNAQFGMLTAESAIIEMAQASGLLYTQQSEQDVLRASTYGVGELILAALDEGATTIYLGLGGSGTNDGGMGMAQALGVKFYQADDSPVSAGLQGIGQVSRIDISGMDSRIAKMNFKILADVKNPFIGMNGATAVYGPQKGVPQDLVAKYDAWMSHFAIIISRDVGVEISQVLGSGAAGGLGGGLLAFCQAEITSGIAEILTLLQAENVIKDADLVITGEGRIDGQSLAGKAPIGVARLAQKYQIPVIALVGGRTTDLGLVYESGVDIVLPILPRPMTLNEAIEEVEMNLVLAGETVMRMVTLSKKIK